MPAPAVRVYRHLRRLIRAFDAFSIPCTGVVGLHLQPSTMSPKKELQRRFRELPSSKLDDAMLAVRMLPQQLAFLKSTEEETRQALRSWHKLQQQYSAAGSFSLNAAVEAVGSAAWQLHAVQAALEDAHSPPDLRDAADPHENPIDVDAARALVEMLAQQSIERTPSADISGKAALRQRLTAISSTLFARGMLKNAPVEWVYDGIYPGLVAGALQHRKGVPLTLAVVYLLVAARAGLHTALVPVDADGAAAGAQAAPRVPAALSSKYASRATLAAPLAARWLVKAEAQTEADESRLFVDVMDKGAVLDADQCAQRYPELRQDSQLDAGAVLGVWSAFARTMVTAYQRRGESDLAAHWIVQLLALDPAAAEWRHMIR